MEKQLTTFFFRYMLKTHFRNKSDMARKLGLDIRRVQRLFRTLDSAKGGTIVLDKLLYFCVSDGIPIDPIIHQFMECEGVKTENNTGGFSTPSIIDLTCGEISSLMVPDTLSEQGIEMAKSVMRIVQAMDAVSPDQEDGLEEKLSTIRQVLHHITTTAYEYILKIYAKEAVNPLDC